MKTIWMIMRWAWGITQIVVCAACVLFTVFVVCPSMEKLYYKLGKEIPPWMKTSSTL